MKGSLAVLGMVGAVLANPMPQVTSAIAPAASAPAGCSTSHSGTFDLTVVNVTSSSKRDLVSRQSDASTLTLTLSNGILKDSEGRTGYIAANQQFQFDNPPQTGAIYTAGWSVCGNDSLALGGTAIFYQCLSGTFYNLYAKSQGNQCAAVYFETSAASGSSSSSSAAASQISDGQPQATTATSAKVSQITDGQPQATTATSAKVSQISDGQPQATTAASSSAKVSQISDGQPQATTAAASSSAKVSQISDGQPQATTAAASSSSAKVSQISDGQPQASTAAATSAKASTVTSSAKVSQISDGQPQATTATAAVATFTGAAQHNVVGRYAFAAGIVGAVALL